MKGIVFNFPEEVITIEHGEDAWYELLEAAQVEGAYTSVGNYPDEELTRLVAAASSALNTPVDDVVRWFGRNAIPLFYQRYPALFEPHTFTRSILLTLNEIIHPEVRKLFPGADVPEFDFDTSEEGHLSLGYHSDRKLCSFAEGLIEGAAQHFGEHSTIKQTKCLKRGDEKCILVCSFKKRD